MFGATHPVWFIAFGVALVAWAIVLMAVSARGTQLARAELPDLPVPAGSPPPLASLSSILPSSPDERVRRGGQHRVDRAAAQERAARDALRCAGARVDVAPVRCPLDRGGAS